MQKLLGGTILVGLGLGLALAPQQASSKPPQGSNAAQSGVNDPVPAYHAQAPQGELPETMNPELFSNVTVKNAYTLAARIKATLYQEPCYCHCDRSKGHTSLLDCFASSHGSECGTCLYEDFYTYEQSRKGKTAAQIREGIIRGEWKSVNAAKYQKPLPKK